LVDLVGTQQSVFAFGMYRFAVNLAFAAGPATAGFLADHSFLYLFVGDALTSIVYGVIALFALPQGLRSDMTGERLGEAVRLPATNRRFLLLLAATVLLTLVDFQLGSTVALHVKSLGLPARVYGLLTSENGLLIICFELWITNFVQRFRPQPVIAAGYLLSGLGFAMTGVARTIPTLAATIVVWTFGEMLSSPMVVGYVAPVTAANGVIVVLVNGLITVDVAEAMIADDRGSSATITPGSQIFAILRSTTSLQASSVIVTTVPQVTLSGPVQSINTSAGTLQVL